LPGRAGEVQVWDVARRELQLSVSVSHDTLFGGSWSPDGSRIAFGCTDNTVRAIDAATGRQVVQQGAHSDWALDTAFSPDNLHLVSVSRDMTAKLTEVATQRFVDNITSITPDTLKGGIQAVVMHPERPEVVVGGADGVPRVYRILRNTARRIGDDANLIRNLPGLRGRIFGIAVNAKGTRVAVAAALDHHGELLLTDYPEALDA
jgi:WD40 repeat protein